jgi:hypothetical protein
VRITVAGHPHSYELAWHNTAAGPVITDLRVHSDAATPITSNTLRRINTDTLARTARRYDTAPAAEASRKLRGALEKASADQDPATMVANTIAWLEEQGAHDDAGEFRRIAAEVGPAELVASGFEGIEAFRWTECVIDAMVTHAPPGVTSPEPPGRRGGRPRHRREFLVQVAEWAREALDRNSGAVYTYVAQRAVQAGERDRLASDETVKSWIKRCKDAGLLGRDELRRPRTPRTDTTCGDRAGIREDV